jgi:hypothetical protein
MRHGATGSSGSSGEQADPRGRSRLEHPSHVNAPAAPSGPPSAGHANPGERGARSELLRALLEFRWDHLAGPYPAAAEITPLLDLWALAVAVDPRAARPIERMLTALLLRTVVTAHELARCLEEVRWALTNDPS